MRYSVIICTHNRSDVLPRALEAIGRLEAPAGAEIELLVVDNASTDGTTAVVRTFAEKAPFAVRYIHEPRLGHSFALNAGIASARGDVIAFTDDDAFPDPGWLEGLHRAFVAERADWAFGPVTPTWESSKPSWYGPEVIAYFAGLNYGAESFQVSDEQHPFIGVNHACRREALLSLGGYREDLGGFGKQGGVGNDEDLFRRALRAGMRIMYAPDAGVSHLIPARRCQKGYHRGNMWAGTAAHFRFLITDPPPPPTLLGVPRYFYRKIIDHAALWAKQTVRGTRSAAFYHELQTLRFGLLICHALRHSCRRAWTPNANRHSAASSSHTTA
jgi:glycosyltransferase involved in cell wall biosynthesis